jgi:hypothetical protein
MVNKPLDTYQHFVQFDFTANRQLTQKEFEELEKYIRDYMDRNKFEKGQLNIEVLGTITAIEH